VLTFVFLKSLSLALNGARGVTLAAILGPESYGAFGTLIVIQQYLSYAALGMREGVTIKLARASGSQPDIAAIYSSSLSWGAGAGLLCLGVMTVLAFTGGAAERYLHWVGLISALSIVNEILININRHENKLRKIAMVELVYNAIVLLIVWLLWRELTVAHALAATFFGLAVGVGAYLVTIREIAWRSVSWHTIRELVGIGFVPAVFSAALVLRGSFYVLAANWMDLGETIGLVVFGNNIGTLILFGLNTVSWALVGRSMTRLYMPSGTKQAQSHPSDTVFRIGVICAVLVALATQFVFSSVMREYAGAEVYVLYFCLFQSYGLLLFNEVNFANVNAKLTPLIAGYVVLAVVLISGNWLARGDFLWWQQLGVVAHFVLAVWITFYCRHLGFKGGTIAQRLANLALPVCCALAYPRIGSLGVVGLCVAFFLAELFLGGGRALRAMAGHVLGKR
jgi:hypothetical protein